MEDNYNAPSAATNSMYFIKPSRGEAPCQNCGKMVTISLPFIGCVFCSDCIKSDTGWNDGTEDFYEKRRLKW